MCSRNTKKIIPIEIFYFINPLDPKCWMLEPVLRKLNLEYRKYFSLRHVLIGNITDLNSSLKKHKKLAKILGKIGSENEIELETSISVPYNAFIAIKASEIQGKKKGMIFRRKLQEFLFIYSFDVSQLPILAKIAKDSNLDVDEFLEDFNSNIPSQAFQADLKIARDMYVEGAPSFVFFNSSTDDPGLKITGNYPYEVYEQILIEKIGQPLKKEKMPPIIDFLNTVDLVSTKEISEIFKMSFTDVIEQMTDLVIMDLAEKIPAKHDDFWRIKR